MNSKVEDFVEKYSDTPLQHGQKTTIVLDPPRDGLHPSAIPYIRALGADEIIYVSCNPATLVRDIALMLDKAPHKDDDEVEKDEKKSSKKEQKILKKYMYQITDVTPVDMFPHTHHIETVVRLEKVGE